MPLLRCLPKCCYRLNAASYPKFSCIFYAAEPTDSAAVFLWVRASGVADYRVNECGLEGGIGAFMYAVIERFGGVI